MIAVEPNCTITRRERINQRCCVTILELPSAMEKVWVIQDIYFVEIFRDSIARIACDFIILVNDQVSVHRVVSASRCEGLKRVLPVS
jgi:hypothetical protein